MVFPKVELHVHLDGALQHKTAWELLKEKNCPLPGDGTLESLVDAVVVKDPVDLQHFLKGFSVFLPAVIGDLEAMERMAYEFCQYQAEEGVIYAEVRYCPQLLMPDVFNDKVDFLSNASDGKADVKGRDVNTTTIVEAVNRGLARGEEDFGIVTRTILSCIRGMPQWSKDILDLCVKFKGRGVVGIDIAGNESGEKPIEEEEKEGRMLDREDIEVFEKAVELGIHRTVHAGEAGPAMMVWKALNVLKAERIGHGYRVIDDDAIYRHCLDREVHFECCPTSSLLTGSVALKGDKVHPIVQFARDKASFSISTDDPTVTNTKMKDEYKLLRQWGLTEQDLQTANINAMKCSFAEPPVKAELLQKLYDAYGISQ